MGAGDQIRTYARRLENAGRKINPLVVDATTKATLDTASAARELAPVDTGYLRASITTATGSDGSTVWGEVTAGAEYATFLENGTSRMAPQPFMRPARETVKPAWLAAMAQLGGKAV